MSHDQWSITEIAETTGMAIASYPAMYLLIGSILLLLLTGTPILLQLYNRDLSGLRLALPYALMVMLTTVYYRMPFIFLPEQNPDESLEIASAATLLQDPVYWRSVDLGTHGPLSTYPLMLPHLFGLRIDYGSTRLIGLAMLLTAVLLIFLRFRKSASNAVAAIAVLPFVTFICMTDYWDFIAYNAEYPVIFMLALSLYFTDKALQAGDRSIGALLFVAGLSVGGALLVKVQCLPILLGIAASTCVIVWLRRELKAQRVRLLLTYSCGCLTFAVLLAVYIWYFDLYNDFVVRFLYGQMNYAESTPADVNKVKQFFKTLHFVNSVSWSYFYLLIFASLLLAALFFTRRGKPAGIQNHPAGEEPSVTTVDRLQLSVLLLTTCMSLAAVYIPGREFRHYFLLVAFPLGVLAGRSSILTNSVLARKSLKNICTVLFVVVTVFGQYVSKYCLSPYFGYILNNALTFEVLTANSKKYTLSTKERDDAITGTIRKYSHPGERMAIWGWAKRFYVETGLVIGCKTSTEQLINSSYGNTPYYMNSFMRELESSNAPVFLDVVAPRQFRFTDREKSGFEQFPRINAYIRDNYSLVNEIEGVRIYVSKRRIGELAAKAYTGL